MTFYDLLRKWVNGERIWDNEKADALDLIDKMEMLNAFGSTALYVGQHDCEPGEPTTIYNTPNWITGAGRWETKPWRTDSRTVVQCKVCGREM
jgi:hypothetical protein